MRTSCLLLACAGVALAGEGFLKVDLEHEHGPRLKLRKRQTDTGELTQQIVSGENGSVRFYRA
jgi:hypothetical protein